ncbi:MAG: alkaline phosphatase family protein [Opitutales bacterium]
MNARRRTAILNVVGLTQRLMEHTPYIRDFARKRGARAIEPVLPAVTCTAQSTYLTGELPRVHGVVANGWYDRAYAEHRFWKQSNRLVEAPKLWEKLRQRRPDFSCAQLFWWYNMYASVNYSITPRPLYLSDGKKVFDIHTQPMHLRDNIKDDLGNFPFRYFWGPASGLPSSEWIAASARWIEQKRSPDLSLIYLPHLDYNLQRLGPEHPAIRQDLKAIDGLVNELVAALETRGVVVAILSEYGITPVSKPVHLNRRFRQQNWLSIKEELGTETLDLGGCEAFALADHQIAHVYLQHGQSVAEVKALVEGLDGVERVLDDEGKRAIGLDHPRSGELVAIAARDRRFSYYYWQDDDRAPDFARTVDIHRKPGFDPVELFVDPAIRFPPLAIGWRLAKRRLGFRTLLDVISLRDTQLVKGAHGRLPDDPGEGPVVISSEPELMPAGPVAAAAFKDLVLDHVFGR